MRANEQARDVTQIDRRLARNFLKTVFATVVMAFVLGGGSMAFGHYFAGGVPQKVQGLTILLLCGALAYGVLIMATGVIKTSDIKTLISPKSKRNNQT